MARDEAGGPAALKAADGRRHRASSGLADPVVGDALTVVTALGPSKGLPSRRDYVQMALLPSVQGLAVEPYIDDLSVTRDNDIVHIGRPGGLVLSPAWPATKEADGLATPARRSRPPCRR